MALQVIGAGLGRTGTFSLKFALEILGYDPCHHMTEVWANLSDQLPKWLGIVGGERNWDDVFDGYSGAVDYPACTFWRELIVRYPEAKVILTTRNPESWFASVHETIFSPSMRNMLDAGPVRTFMDGTVWGDLGEGIDDPDFMTAYFNHWNAQVIASVPADKLLVFEAKDGWEPLCRFLDKPIPGIAYPRTNSRDEIKHRIAGEQQESDPAMFEAKSRAFLAAQRAAAFGATA